MTRRHFAHLAQALRDSRPTGYVAIHDGTPAYNAADACWRTACVQVAHVCESENPRFDERRFLIACGYYADAESEDA